MKYAKICLLSHKNTFLVNYSKCASRGEKYLSKSYIFAMNFNNHCMAENNRAPLSAVFNE